MVVSIFWHCTYCRTTHFPILIKRKKRGILCKTHFLSEIRDIYGFALSSTWETFWFANSFYVSYVQTFGDFRYGAKYWEQGDQVALIKTHQEGMDWQIRTSLEACQNNWIMVKAEMQGKNIRCKVSPPICPKSVQCNQSILKLWIGWLKYAQCKRCTLCTVPICSLRCSVKSGGKFWHRSQCGRFEPTFSTLAGVFFRCTRWVGESSANSFSLKTCLRFLSGLSTLYLQVFLLCIFLLFSHGWQQCRGWLMITSWILFSGSSWMARRKKKWY